MEIGTVLQLVEAETEKPCEECVFDAPNPCPHEECGQTYCFKPVKLLIPAPLAS